MIYEGRGAKDYVLCLDTAKTINGKPLQVDAPYLLIPDLYIRFPSNEVLRERPSIDAPSVRIVVCARRIDPKHVVEEGRWPAESRLSSLLSIDRVS